MSVKGIQQKEPVQVADATTGAWALTLGGLGDGARAVLGDDRPAAPTRRVRRAAIPFAFTVDITTSESAIGDAVATGTDGKSHINAANFNGGSTTLTGQAGGGRQGDGSVGPSPPAQSSPTVFVAADGAWSFPPPACSPLASRAGRSVGDRDSDRPGRQHGAEFDLHFNAGADRSAALAGPSSCRSPR